jgi:hypothetical protein
VVLLVQASQKTRVNQEAKGGEEGESEGDEEGGGEGGKEAEEGGG